MMEQNASPIIGEPGIISLNARSLWAATRSHRAVAVEQAVVEGDFGQSKQDSRYAPGNRTTTVCFK
jgi:hypothetical protein